VTRYLIDTNTFSELSRPVPSRAVVGWMSGIPDPDLFIATITIAEIWRGILQRPDSRGRRERQAWFSGPTGPQSLFFGRILPFDQSAAMRWAQLMAEGFAAGRPRSPIDMIIAATAAANDCVVVTANERHFEGVVAFLNPLRIAP